MGSLILKPGTSKGTVFLVDTTSKSYKKGVAPVIKTADGKTYQGKLINTVDEGGGPVEQYGFPGLPQNAQATLDYGGDVQDINTSSRFEGNAIGSLQGSGGGVGSAPGGLTPTRFGAGYLPAFLGGQIPQFNPIPGPNYKMFDPSQYSQQYGKAINNQILSNFQQSKGLALDTLSTELSGLKAFEPAAAGLAREQAAIDNLQNQSQRTQQLNKVIPDVLGGLKQQTADARTYASGHLLSSADDFGLSLGATGGATDLAATRGFGDNSTYAKGAQALTNAMQRFQISQYGNQLEQSNAQTRAGLEVAPTEYINAGQQIKVTPSVDAGTLSGNYFKDINALTTIPASQALSADINQNQFLTSNTIDVNKFNASNVYASQLNAFNYISGFAQQAAGLGTAQVNQNRADAQQAALQQLFQKGMNQAQTAQTISQILGGFGASGGLIKNVTDLINGYGSGSPSGTSTPAIDINSTPGQIDQALTPQGVLNYDTWNTSTTYTPDYSGSGIQFGVDATQFNADLGLAP